MKFDFQKADQPVEADWPVVINVPIDGGKVEKRTFTARFRMLKRPDLEKLVDQNIADAHLVQRSFWIGLGADETDTFTPELFNACMELPYFRVGLEAAYRAFIQGVETKN